MKDFRDLKVWQKAHQLTLAIYRVTAAFPSSELYGLTSQMRRSSASVPANIAEGACRDGDAEFCRFLHIAMGSASEVDYFLLLACDLGFLRREESEGLMRDAEEVKRMLSALINKLKADRSES